MTPRVKRVRNSSQHPDTERVLGSSLSNDGDLSRHYMTLGRAHIFHPRLVEFISSCTRHQLAARSPRGHQTLFNSTTTLTQSSQLCIKFLICRPQQNGTTFRAARARCYMSPVTTVQ